eukprot:5600857-Pyramimonas_sp.AAC.1
MICYTLINVTCTLYCSAGRSINVRAIQYTDSTVFVYLLRTVYQYSIPTAAANRNAPTPTSPMNHPSDAIESEGGEPGGGSATW